MNKLEIINKTISEIRETLGAECANIEDLPDMIKQLATDPSKSGFTTAFVFSSESHPNTPTGGSLDTTTGLVVDIDESWSQGVEERVATFKTRSVSESSTNWMSFAVFGPSGERVTEWSIPINLKGAKGEQGIPGQIGAQGPIGPKGEKGDSANSYRTVSVYTTTETIDTPSKPNGGFWDLSTNTIIKPTSDSDKYEWFLNADEVKKNNYLWMSQATFEDTGELINDWCLPFRLTGEAGKNGADGRATEFIYRLVPDYETYKELKKSLTVNKLYSPEYEDDKVPAVNDDLNIGTIWTDQPKGITETMQVEVCCTRIRKNIDEPWSEWSNCIIWSKWGEDGLDGDGVEYIYLVTTDKTNEGESIDKDYVLTYLTPNRKTALDNEYYQQDGFCFNGNWGYSGYDWSDEPKDVGPGKPLEWVMIRKKKKNNKENVVWGEFSDPAIWGRFAEDGLPYLTSFVFTRSIKTPDQPTGGSYENPKPDQSIWSDSVPVISETMKGPVWMSTRVFYAGDVNAFDKDWTLPKIIADTHDFQVEYSKGNENGLVPHLDPFTGNEETWRAQQETNYGIKWGDDSQITDPTWMITSSCDNGVWKPWVLTRIKGEKGAAGQNGTSVEVRGKFPTLAAIKEEWREYAEDGTDFYGTTILHNGDAYFVEENGMLYIYNGGFYPGEETTFEVYWAEVQLTGEKGDSFYFYVAYCETLNEGATLYFDAPKKYIGTIVSDKPLEQDYLNKWSSYKNWTKWLGEDGWGQEQIFLLTSKNASYDPAIAGKKPLLPVNEEGQGNIKEYLPLHGLGDLAKGADDQPDRWSDSPLTVSEDYPYCWVVSRSVPEFGAWKGDGSYASLYSRYSYDGKDGNSTISVNLTNDLAVIPMEGDVIDPEFIASHVVTTSLQVFIGDDSIPSDRTTVSIEGGYATWDESTDIITLNFDKLPANVNEIPIIVTVDGGSNHTITWKLFKTDTAYEISPDVHVIKRYVEGDKTGQLETKSFDVKVKKWDGEKWIASNKAVFVEITTKEGKQWYSNQSNVVTETSGGTATVNIGEIHDIKAITVYLTNDDKDNGTRISFEDIAIVADGITGPQGPQGLAGLDANASFKSTVFRRGEGPFNAPEGGDYNSPKPTTDGWFESIPDGTAILWASTRIFSSDGKYPQENKWSVPAKMTDTADFDVEFSSTINPGNPTSNPENWSNNSDTSTIWMAIRKAKNGVWTEWQISKIKGEDGADGHSIVMHETEPTNPKMGDGYVNDNGELLIWDGDSWVDCGKIKGEDAVVPTIVDGYWAFWNGAEYVKSEFIAIGDDGHSPYVDGGIWWEWDSELNKYVSTGIKAEGKDGVPPRIGSNNNWQFWDGEKYVDSGYSAIGDDGHSPYIKDDIWWEWNGSEYVSTGIRAKGIDGTDGINGKDGTNNFIHVKYASEVTTNSEGYGITGKFTESDGEEPGKYMGIYVDDVENDVLDITKYKWTKAEGEDGFGYEYIYQRNNNPVAPIVPTDITTDDVAPTGWTDGPSGVNSTEMYEWVCWRKKTGGEWSKWIGSAENNGVAALWAKFGEKGETGENGKDAVISQAMLDQAAANIAQGFYTKEQIDALETSLNNAISSGDAKAIADAAAALKTANEVNTELESLQSKFNDDGTIKDSILREEDIYNLSKAALGTDISENGVIAQQIVGLVGTYGKINVDNLIGDTISGKTVQSADANGNLGKAWKLENTGAGHIANGQISWNTDGVVTLSENVEIKWSQVTGHETLDQSVANATNTANTANTNASAAQTTANAANTTANTASTTANNAINAANTANTNAQKAQTAAGEAKTAAQTASTVAGEAKSIANTANSRMDDLVDDDVISKAELKTIKDELVYINSDKSDIDNQVSRYSLNNTNVSNLGSSYTNYKGTLESIINTFDDGAEKIDDLNTLSNLESYQESYYQHRTAVLNDIAAAAKKVADDAQTAADTAKATADEAKRKVDNMDISTTVDTAITTKLDQFSIASNKITGNLIDGKTFQSSTNKQLINGTRYATYSEPSSDGTYIETTQTAGSNSTGPAWQLRDGGEGYLAQGNIRWDKNGKVTFGSGVKLTWDSVKDAVEGNINLPEDLTILKIEGEIDEYVYVGVHPIEGAQEYIFDSAGIWILREYYDENTSSNVNNYGYGTKFVLTENDQPVNGEMCELVEGYYENSYFYIDLSFGDKVVDSVQFVSSTGLTKSDVENVINSTIISNGYIQTNLINTNDLTVKKLDTRNGGKGTITIKDNQINVNDATSTSKRVLTITGDSIEDISEKPQSFSFSSELKNEVWDGFEDLLQTNIILTKLGSITTNSECKVFINENTAPKIQLRLVNNSYNIVSINYLDVYADIYFAKVNEKESNIKSNMGDYFYRFTDGYNIPTTGYTFNLNGSQADGHKGGICCMLGGTRLSYGNQSTSNTLPAGTYNVYQRLGVKITSATRNLSVGGLIMQWDDHSDYMLYVNPESIEKLTEIGSNGFRVFNDSTHYFSTDGHSFIMRSGEKSFGIDDKGFFLTIDTKDGNSTITSKYYNLEMSGSPTSGYQMIFKTKETNEW